MAGVVATRNREGMKMETLRLVIERIERRGDPVEVYTDGKRIWCDGYPDNREFDVELIGVYWATAPSYDPGEIGNWIRADFEATA